MRVLLIITAAGELSVETGETQTIIDRNLTKIKHPTNKIVVPKMMDERYEARLHLPEMSVFRFRKLEKEILIKQKSYEDLKF